VRAVVIEAGRPRLAELPEPEGAGELLRVRACGLCGSDVEKLETATAGAVLGHEVVAEREDGSRLVLVHHLPCGECERCRAGHESTCEQFRAATIRPGGFAEHVRAAATLELPLEIDDVAGTYAEPLACVLRGAERVPRGSVIVLGGGFIGRLFAEVLEQRGDEVFVVDPDPERAGADPTGPAGAVVVAARGAAASALEHVAPGGTILVFADGGPIDLAAVYRNELTLVGTRSATPRHLEEAIALLPSLVLPPATLLPLDRFEDGLALYRSGEALKVVFTP